ncbi:putative chitinase II [Klebsiella pneumoniae subsp. pneumoniae]|nr:putative chitinase II [Klebsiella pneumoniae subsp. pneumoniae]
MKRLPLLAALPLLCASALSAQPLMSVGYFNGGGDVTAGPGGDIDKLDVRQITHLNYSFGLIYNDEKDETNAALKDPAHLHEIWLSPKVQADLQKLPPCVNRIRTSKSCCRSAAGARVVSPARRRPQKVAPSLFVPRRKSSSNMVWTALTSTGSFRSTAPGDWWPASRLTATTSLPC